MTEPAIALKVCPPMTFLGWDRGDSGVAYSRTAEAPNEPTVRGIASNAATPSEDEMSERA